MGVDGHGWVRVELRVRQAGLDDEPLLLVINGHLNFDEATSCEPEYKEAYLIAQFVFEEVGFGYIWLAKALNDLLAGFSQ